MTNYSKLDRGKPIVPNKRHPTKTNVTLVPGLLDVPKVQSSTELAKTLKTLAGAVGGNARLAEILGVSRATIWKVQEGQNDSPTIRRILGIKQKKPRARVTVSTTDMRSAAASLRRVLDFEQLEELSEFIKEKETSK